MREIRLSGSEGGGTEYNPFSLPLSKLCLHASRQTLQFDITELDAIAFRFQAPIAFGNLRRREFTGQIAIDPKRDFRAEAANFVGVPFANGVERIYCRGGSLDHR